MKLRTLKKNKKGQLLIEYGLIIAVMGIIAIAALPILIGGANPFERPTPEDCIPGPGPGPGPGAWMKIYCELIEVGG